METRVRAQVEHPFRIVPPESAADPPLAPATTLSAQAGIREFDQRFLS